MFYQRFVYDKVVAINWSLMPAVVLALISFSITACGGSFLLRANRNIETRVKPAIKNLVKAEPAYFESPFTLVVLLDTKACGPNLKETEWWSDWQRQMNDKGMGFLLVTSKKDSADVAIAAQMDGVDVPVIVLPESGAYVSDLWAPAQSIPVKLLVDAESGVRRFWLVSVLNEEISNIFLAQVDSLISSMSSNVQ